MKTEGLDYREALQAYLDGKCLEDKDGDTYRLNGETPEYWDQDHWSAGNPLVFRCAPFSIVPDPSIPEPNSLTMEEAVGLLDKDKKIKVKYSETTSNILELSSHFDPQIRFNELISFTSYLDLAERKGWPITEVTQ
jgi:hypothetical protein